MTFTTLMKNFQLTSAGSRERSNSLCRETSMIEAAVRIPSCYIYGSFVNHMKVHDLTQSFVEWSFGSKLFAAPDECYSFLSRGGMVDVMHNVRNMTPVIGCHPGEETRGSCSLFPSRINCLCKMSESKKSAAAQKRHCSMPYRVGEILQWYFTRNASKESRKFMRRYRYENILGPEICRGGDMLYDLHPLHQFSYGVHISSQDPHCWYDIMPTLVLINICGCLHHISMTFERSHLMYT